MFDVLRPFKEKLIILFMRIMLKNLTEALFFVNIFFQVSLHFHVIYSEIHCIYMI